jgi:hypothetical protein
VVCIVIIIVSSIFAALAPSCISDIPDMRFVAAGLFAGVVLGVIMATAAEGEL